MSGEAKIGLTVEPYDLGREGAGPIRYLKANAGSSLSGRGFEVETETVKRRGPFEDEPSAVADVDARLAERVGEAVYREASPIVLGGNRDGALGVLAGLGSSGVGIVWLDAHGDFNTPQTSPSGYLGGMMPAIATGGYHEELRASVGIKAPIPESRVLMVGVRGLDPEEAPRLEGSAIRVVEAGAVVSEGTEAALRGSLDELRSRVREICLHLDVDPPDPRHAPGVGFPVPGGLSVEDAEEAVRMVAQSFRVGAATLAAYDPDKDEDDTTLRAGMRLVNAIAEAAVGSRSEAT